MGLCVRVVRGLAIGCLILGGILVGAGCVTVASSGVAVAQTASSIVVEGNRRVEAETIRSYFKPGPGGRLGPEQEDEALKALFATGSVCRRPHQPLRRPPGGHGGREPGDQPGRLRRQQEGQRRAAHGRSAVEAARDACRGRPCRPTCSASSRSITAAAASTSRSIRRSSSCRTTASIWCSKSRKARKPASRISNFVGAHAYSSGRLKDVIKTSESNWLSFLQTTDIYDPDRIEADRDLLRRFYLKHGYADVRIVSAVGEYDPAKKGFVVTFTIDEGGQYRVGTVDVISNVHAIDPASLRSQLKLSAGNVYNADLVEKSVEAMTIEAAKHGYAFANVRPRGDRNFETKTINLTFVVEEGARAYIERINIRGNTRTRDYVIRREFDLGEGDAYNRALIDRAERRLKNLNYFKTVKITNEPGSAPDRVVINVDVEEHANRRILDFRRLFHRRRLHRRSQRRRPQPDGPRPLCQGVGDLRAICARLRSVVRRALICSAIAWPAASILFARQNLANNYVSYDSQTIGTNLRLGFALTEELAFQPRYSIYQQKITLPTNT